MALSGTYSTVTRYARLHLDQHCVPSVARVSSRPIQFKADQPISTTHRRASSTERPSSASRGMRLSAARELLGLIRLLRSDVAGLVP